MKIKGRSFGSPLTPGLKPRISTAEKDAPGMTSGPRIAVIGLTGGIGSGKSTAGKYFQKLGYQVYEADEMAQTLLDRAEIKNRIVRLFGLGVTDKSGRLSRKKLGNLVFENRAKLAALEKVLHPPVIHEIKAGIKKAKSSRKKNQKGIVFIVPLLFEKKLENLFDVVLTISCPRQTRLERASRRLGLTKEEIEKRMRFQLDSKTREEKSGRVIRNNGSRLKMQKEIKRFSEKLLQDGSSRTVSPKKH
jgi:dephospho-CoA kinase